MSLDPGIYTQIQNTQVGVLSTLLSQASGYSQDLLYLCASIDVVLLALLWAISGNNGFSRLLFTILKIGFLLLVINEFDTWLSLLLTSLGQIASQSPAAAGAIKLIEAPGAIWQYGFDNGIVLLKAATNDGVNMGLSLLLTVLGLGTLLVFGLLGARLIVSLAAFYMTALIALLFLPFGALKPTTDFAYRGLQSVLKSAVGLFTLLLVLGVATTIWQSQNMLLTDQFTINQILGIFFSGLVFLLLANHLPKIAANAIGHIQPFLSDTSLTTNVTSQGASTGTLSPPSASADLQAATTIDPSQGSLNGRNFDAAVHIAPGGSNATGSLAPDMAKRQSSSDRGRFGSATEVAPSISGATLQKLNTTRQASGD